MDKTSLIMWCRDKYACAIAKWVLWMSQSNTRIHLANVWLGRVWCIQDRYIYHWEVELSTRETMRWSLCMTWKVSGSRARHSMLKFQHARHVHPSPARQSAEMANASIYRSTRIIGSKGSVPRDKNDLNYWVLSIFNSSHTFTMSVQ